MKASIVYSLMLLGFNASSVSAQDAANRVLRGSSTIIAFEDYVKDTAQEVTDKTPAVEMVQEQSNEDFDESQCSGPRQLCSGNSQCCNGLVCSARRSCIICRDQGSFCLSNSECCSGVCSGYSCSSGQNVGDNAQELLEEVDEVEMEREDSMQDEKEEFVETMCTGPGRRCSDNSQCCDGLICGARHCVPACGPPRFFCIQGSDCCSGQCTNRRCSS